MENFIIIPGVGKNSQILAEEVKKLTNIPILSSSDKSVSSKDSPFVQGFFYDFDSKAEIGKDTLKELENKTIVLVRYMQDDIYSINDNLMQLRALCNLLDNTKILAIPYTPFLRSHNIEKYAEKGLLQADTLSLFVDQLTAAKINKVITIMPHSEKFCEVAKKKEIEVIHFTPFKTFQKIFEEKYPDAYILIPDDGAEELGKEFAKIINLPEDRLLAFEKTRTGEGCCSIDKLKPWCKINTKELKGKTAIILDDMISSGGSANKLAKRMKENHNMEKVILMVAHSVCPDPDNLKINHLDEIYSLGTIPQEIKEINIINDHAKLLAEGINNLIN